MSAKIRAAGFALGSVIAVGAIFGLDELLGPLHIGIVNLAVLPVGALVGGAVAGASLGLGKRGIAGFAVAYAAAIPLLLVVLVALQAMSASGDEFLVVIPSALAYAAVGAIGVGISGLGSQESLRSAIEFGAAGFAGSLVFAFLLGMSAPGARDANRMLLWAGSTEFFVLPAAVGAYLLLRRLEERGASASADTP